MKTVFNTALAAISIFAIACGGEDLTTMESGAGPEELDTVPQGSGEALAGELESIPVSEALADELEGKLNSYARAVLDRDVDVLQGLMSTEVLGQIDAKGTDMGAFADKMSKSMLRTFETMTSSSDMGWFAVESARIEGNAVRVEVSRQGETLGKPFYFVDEQGEYKLNLVSPGFSRPLAEGAAGSWNDYLLRNGHSQTAHAYCTTGSHGYIPPYSDGYMSCTDKCGFWSGARFFANFGELDQTHAYCDYNTWGVDAQYSWVGGNTGWRVLCVEPC